MSAIMSLLISSLAVFVSAYIIPGVRVDSFVTALIVAIVLGVVNLLVKPVLIILTLPITLITFGLFLLVINALSIILVDMLVPGFEVDGFLWALLFAIVLSAIGSFLNSLTK